MESKFSSETIKKVQEYVEKQFDSNILPSLMDYVRIPNLSRAYDSEYLTNGLLEKAANFLIDWVKQQNVKGLNIELHNDPGKTPLIFAEIEGTSANTETILLYGHFDKQPHMTGWKEGLSPIDPVIRGDKLYGRGAADDGYAIYNSVMAIKALQELGMSHPRCVILIEGDEESSSQDLSFYFNKLEDRIGSPAILICMDSGCGNYNQLWLTSTLRGMLGMDIKVKIIDEGVHSGIASGVIPDTFRIIRMLLERIEDLQTGEVIKDLHVTIPEERLKQAESVAKVIGKEIINKFPWVSSGKPVGKDELTCYLNRVWRPTLVVIGMNDIPPTHVAGNVLRPETTFRISVRLPPTLDSTKAVETVKKLITENPPYGAEVTVSKVVNSNGWNAPANQQYLDDILNKSSHNFFGKESLYFGEGVSIPFLNFLGNRFPQAQFVVTGVLGPQSNAHGPNESLDLPFTKKLLCCMVQTIGEVYPHLEKH